MSIYEYRGLDKLMIMEHLWERWALRIRQIVKRNLYASTWTSSSKCFSKSHHISALCVRKITAFRTRWIEEELKGYSITLANGPFLHSLDFHDLRFETKSSLYHSYRRHSASVDTARIRDLLMSSINDRVFSETDAASFELFEWKKKDILLS